MTWSEFELSNYTEKLAFKQHFLFHFIYLLTYLSLVLRRSRTGKVWFYTSISNKRAARPKL